VLLRAGCVRFPQELKSRQVVNSLVSETIIVKVNLLDTLPQRGQDGVKRTEPVAIIGTAGVGLVNGEHGVVAVRSPIFSIESGTAT
jgi:hypothetical protein